MRSMVRWLAMLTTIGCASHATGLARPAGAGVEIEQMDGTRWRLVTGPDSAPLRALDGHTITVAGQRLGRSLRVTGWRVDQGLHGMPVWVGTVRRLGAQVAIEDRNTGGVVVVDDAAVRTLAAHEGDVVLVEGYGDGPNRVKVMFWRSLAVD